MLSPDRVAIVNDCGTSYPTAPFDPHEHYAERPSIGKADQPNAVYAGVRRLLIDLGMDADHLGTPAWNPLSDLIHPGDCVLFKPNLVLDFNAKGHPLEAVVTHAAVLRPLVDYALMALRGRGRIVIADSSHGNCDFPVLLERNGVAALVRHFRGGSPPVEVRDLRQHVYGHAAGGFLREVRRRIDGDPLGYVEVDLGTDSAVEGLMHLERLYGADWDRAFIRRCHTPGSHRYLVAGTVLNSDVVIGVPKLKTHYKVGITVNLKNLVGIIGDKNWLPHYRIGDDADGGDEMPPMRRESERLLVRAERLLQDALLAPNSPAGRRLYRIAHLPYRALRAAVVSREDRHAAFGQGNWSGNDTAWRMALDLNQILHHASADGRLHDKRQRRFMSVVDGIIGGEGDGPLGPEARPGGVLIAGFDAPAVDFVAAMVMGFAPERIPIIQQSFAPRRYAITASARDRIEIIGQRRNLRFRPPRGWAATLAPERAPGYGANDRCT